MLFRSVEKHEVYDKLIFTKSKYFSSYKYDIHGNCEISEEAPFVLCTVVNGEGTIGSETVKKGDNFIVPAGYGKMKFSGNLEILAATI